jgi:hypothetical protein
VNKIDLVFEECNSLRLRCTYNEYGDWWNNNENVWYFIDTAHARFMILETCASATSLLEDYQLSKKGPVPRIWLELFLNFFR